MGYRSGLVGLRDPRVVTEFARIIARNYTPRERWELHKITVRAWLRALDQGDEETKAKMRVFWKEHKA